MRKSTLVTVAVILLILGLVQTVLSQYQAFLQTKEVAEREAGIRGLQQEILGAAAKDPDSDPEPFIVLLRELKTSATSLDERTSQPLLRHLVVKKMRFYAESIEAALYQKDYQRANTHRILLREMLRVFGDPYQISPMFRCIDDAYQNHTFLYGDNDAPSALGSSDLPPKEICVEFKAEKRGL